MESLTDNDDQNSDIPADSHHLIQNFTQGGGAGQVKIIIQERFMKCWQLLKKVPYHTKKVRSKMMKLNMELPDR